MIQVDLDTIKQKWYNIGLNASDWSDNDFAELKALDRYQREQVLESHKKGIDDRFDFPVL